ncbi:MAG: type II secretion system protein GspG, partial [Candidatus Sumerlaeota bacterium]|nr:type II secretion system protein GspG [Candidatus Sumerlaeota bacterium]
MFTYRSPKGGAAFTLIELLIVIAIIAILALIAIPNFLEAQVRSKVSRAHADMRSIATAIEAYYVDYNAYPLSEEALSDGCVSPLVTASWRFSHWKTCLTTPVAYITSIPQDPFFKKTGNRDTEDNLRNYKYRMPLAAQNGHIKFCSAQAAKARRKHPAARG